jgi:hypothetical protein
VLWHKTELKEVSPGTYLASQPTPEVGWTAFFVDVTWGPNSVI